MHIYPHRYKCIYIHVAQPRRTARFLITIIKTGKPGIEQHLNFLIKTTRKNASQVIAVYV